MVGNKNHFRKAPKNSEKWFSGRKLSKTTGGSQGRAFEKKIEARRGRF